MLVKKAYNIPFYKERFDASGVKPSDIKTAEDFTKLPVLTKDELREWMNKIADNPEYKDCFIDTTSGSTGKPLTHILSPKEKAYNSANWYRVLMLCGYNPFKSKTMSPIMAHSISGENTSFVQKLGILRRRFVYQYATEQEVVDQINDYKPDMIYMNKSIFMRIALYCKDNNIYVHKPSYYCPTGEVIDEMTRSTLDYVFKGKCGLIDSYGTSETGSMMVKSYDKDVFRINHDSFVINIYDNDNKPSDEGKVIVTPLYLTDFPLINYELGDKVTSENRNGERFITKIHGRVNDYFKYEDGSVTTFFEIAPIIAQTNGLLQIRFIQKSYTEISIQCVKDKVISDISKSDIENRLTVLLNKKFKKSFDFDFNWTDSIPPDKNGKLRMIVCEV